MPSGGPRAGTRTGTYEQRSDLQAGPRTARGPAPAAYGEGKRREAVTQTPELPQPGQLTPLEAASQRPTEPVTAGIDTGPGPGSEVLNPAVAQNDALFDIRALVAEFPEYAKHLAPLIAMAEDES